MGATRQLPPDRLPELPVKRRIWSQQPDEYETAYLRRMMSDCAGLEWLRLVRKQDEKTPAVGLDSVYTALMTESLADKEPNSKSKLGELPRRLSALEVLNGNQRLVLTGTPGSGKSAFVNYLALCLAGEKLGDSRANLRTLTEPLPDENGRPQTEGEEKREVRQPWDHTGLIPVRIILRDFAVSEHFPVNDEKADAQCILNFLRSDFETKACIEYFQRLEKRIRDGDALLMFDGLDEVAKAGEKRKRLIACIHGCMKSFGHSRFLVTCRPFAYEQQDWQLEGFSDATLAGFERGQMIRFIERWYSGSPDFESGPATARAEKLKAALFQRPALYALAKQLLLLSLIAYLHANRHELPERRADLYERLLELLIDEWEKARFKSDDAEAALQREQHSLAEFLQLGQDTIRLVLERLAFQVHACEPRGDDSDPVRTADIAAKDLSHQLLCEAKKAGRERIDALEICEYLRDRVGILYQRGGASELDAVYTFPHRSFQEYLAAAYLRREEEALFKGYPDCEDWQSLIAQLAGGEPDRWREVILLAGGIKSQKEPGPVWDLLDALYPEAVEHPEPENAWALRFAGEILADNLKHSNLNRKQSRIFNGIRNALPKLLSTPHLRAVERAAIGRYLSVIGDPRAEITDVDSMRFCRVPAGVFWMGKGTADDKSDEWTLPETPAGKYDLDYEYWMAENPVTVAQFRAFVIDRQYQLPDEKSLKDNNNEPVAYVTWRDAKAFCEWLTERWREMGWLPSNWRVTLPDEPEWEKAAKGGFQIPATPRITAISEIFVEPGTLENIDGKGLQENPLTQRRYPWANEINEELANYNMNIGRVSTPGVFTKGQSVHGCQDLGGNVWEWTRSQRGNYPYPKTETEAWRQREGVGDAGRVLRGGAFYNAPGDVRAAVRDLAPPDYRDLFIGFRVCLSPFPLSDDSSER